MNKLIDKSVAKIEEAMVQDATDENTNYVLRTSRYDDDD
jgi:hypothetical protein